MDELYAFGWLPDLPDRNDYDVEHPKVDSFLKKAKVAQPNKAGTIKLPDSWDENEKFVPRLQNQASLGSCTAHLASGMLGYFHRKVHNSRYLGSRLFTYKTTRNMMGVTGDTGAYIRTTLKSLVVHGMPPESCWKYVIEDFDKQPSGDAFSFSKEYQLSGYARLDSNGVKGPEIVSQMKAQIVAGIPSGCGFSVYETIRQAELGRVPFPSAGEKLEGGHAIWFPSYNDKIEITNPHNNVKTVGAFRFPNYWGSDWGDVGWGWLPYEYFLQQEAMDVWCMFDAEWLDVATFN